MTAAEVLRTLRARGVLIEVDAGRLYYEAPAATLTDDDRAALRQHRDELLVLLQAEAELARIRRLYGEEMTDEERRRLEAEDDRLGLLTRWLLATPVEGRA